MQSISRPELINSALSLPQLNNTNPLGTSTKESSFSTSDTLKLYSKTDGVLRLKKPKGWLLLESRPVNNLTPASGKLRIRSIRATHPHAAITDSDSDYGTLILCFFGVCLGLLLLLISLLISSFILALVGLSISLFSFFYALITT